MPNPEPSPSRLAAVQGLGFVAVAVLGLGFQLWLPRVLPGPEDERAVATVLGQEAQPGDEVLLHPWWTDRARLLIPQGLPITSYLGDETNALLQHPRIWVLAQHDLPRTPETAFAAGFLPGRTPLGPERHFGHYGLTLYRNGRARPVRFSAVDALLTASATVQLAGAGQASCVQEGAGFRCPAGTRVEAAWHEVFYRPTHCLFVVPPGGPGAVELTFDAVPEATALRLEAAIVWEHAWKHGNNLTPLHVSLSDADTGAPLAALSVEPGTEGFVVAETEARAHRLKLRVQSDNAHEREACLVLQALDAKGAPP